MPKVKIDHIISFSSEDPVHVANNILSSDTSKKWKCHASGEKNATVVLQLEKAVVITGIDIGNEHSAYVEVLVSRSGMNEDYKVLLVTSSFMTPLESRQSQNVNKVRMFTREHFSKPECDEKWDRMKIVCTQPFNKHIQYGLSFINIHTSDEKTSAPVQTHIGKFILRPESPDNLTVGSLFQKQKQLKQEEKLTGAAAIREASSLASLALYGSPVCKAKLKNSNAMSISNSKTSSTSDNSEEKPKPRNRNEVLYSKDEEEPNAKIDKIMDKVKDSKEKKANLNNEVTTKQKLKGQASKTDSKTPNKKDKNDGNSITLDIPSSSKKKETRKTPESNRKRKVQDEGRPKQESKKVKKVNSKPFGRLLEGVILVISGIQNPDRANLRTQALSMGAKYKSDWDNTCTHLICAFPNTPKFNQVKGKGKIVRRTWIEDCHSQRKRLPWRRYALDKNDIGKNESEEEICEEVVVTRKVEQVSDSESDSDKLPWKGHELNKNEAKRGRTGDKLRKQTKPSLPCKIEQVSDSESDDEELPSKRMRNGSGEDLKIKTTLPRKIEQVSDSEPDDDQKEEFSDSEERIARIQEREKGNQNDIYNADTDEETSSSEIPQKMKNLFDKKKFYVDQTFDTDVYNKLQKYIEVYRGRLIDDPTKNIDIIVTKKENSNSMKDVNSSALCLSAEWVFDCHSLQKLISTDPFVL